MNILLKICNKIVQIKIKCHLNYEILKHKTSIMALEFFPQLEVGIFHTGSSCYGAITYFERTKACTTNHQLSIKFFNYGPV